MADERGRPTDTQRDELIRQPQAELARLREELAETGHERDRLRWQHERLERAHNRPAVPGPAGCTRFSPRPWRSAIGGRAKTISEHGLAVARGRLLGRLSRLIDTAPTLPAAQRFAAHLDREFPAVFGFLWAPDVEATNWRAEHAIRPAVVNRKICGGNRTPRGAQTQQILASVVRTARQRHLDLDDLFTTLLRTPTPTVPIALQAPTQ